MAKLLTVFTPTYNRAHTLTRTFESLKRQDDFCFEWLIIDDGSTDNTRELVENWMKENLPFRIRYLYKKNGGMHSAYNEAYKNIQTELNTCIDSDDCLAEGAARIIRETWEKIKSDHSYAGIIGLDADFSDQIIGSIFPEDFSDTSYSKFYGDGGTGDKKFVFRTSVIREFPPYPEFPGENYVGIACKFVLIDQKYKMLGINKILCNVEYQPDGSTNTMYSAYIKNPNGFIYNRKLLMKYPVSKKRLIIETIHYVSSSIQIRDKNFIHNSPRKFLTLILIPAGLLLNLHIKHTARKLGYIK